MPPPGALRTGTAAGAARMAARRATLATPLADLDRQCPGLRLRRVDAQHRLRPHLRVVVDGRAVRDQGHAPLRGQDAAIVPAPGGG